MRAILICLSATWLVGAPAALCAQDKLLVQVPALLPPEAPIEGSVKRDCNVESLIGHHVFKNVSERVAGAAQIADPAKAGPDRVLKLTIMSVTGAGGGAWSGSKAISIRVELSQNSKVVASTSLSRTSGGGMFGGMKGTCSIMERIAEALGKDVAAWLPAGLAAVPAVPPAAATAAPSPAAQPSASQASAPAVDKPAAEPKQ